jgi:hypothetical protein
MTFKINLCPFAVGPVVYGTHFFTCSLFDIADLMNSRPNGIQKRCGAANYIILLGNWCNPLNRNTIMQKVNIVIE